MKSSRTGETFVHQEVTAEIDDLWMELSCLKKAKTDDYALIQKKLRTSYVVIVISWLLFIMFFILLLQCIGVVVVV